ncbi:DinB family protein [Sutcliffiella cohnii]|uniref:DinB family protein n=1 Tax=Sutcliffiella TaxID=2837511 RepID=UPI0022DD89AB|nr:MULTISPECIES: DinB family protein [Sutcliffiella]MED4017052.1 DinB family protein [Sutcliffiella cohnii]WBL13709.1 DinB family protein [Sutcliffiella sp. NC1]
MYRTVNDFLVDWSNSSHGTLRVLEALTDEKLDQSIVEGHSSLGWLGWHIVTSTAFFANLAGLDVKSPGSEKSVPTSANEIANAFRKIIDELKLEVDRKLTDEKLLEEVESFGRTTPRGALLKVLMDHSIHHRGQMTVLLRQAGLQVPGVMGPTKEDGLVN